MAYKDMQAERLQMQQELVRFKTEISLFDIAQSRYGFEVNYEKSTPRNVQAENNISMTNGRDKMIVSNKGNWLYWDTSEQVGVNNKIGGDVISFVQWQEGACSLGHVRKILRPYLSGKAPPHTRQASPKQTPKNEDKTSQDEKDIPLVVKTLAKLKPAVQSDYLQSRNITANTLNTPLFRDRVLLGYNKALIFPHWNEDGLCGFEFKNAEFAGFSKHGYKGLWYSQIPKNLEQLVFVESSLEALSHYQIFKPKNTAYFTASGNWTPKTGELIGKVMSKYPHTKIVAAFNHDKGGQKQTQKLRAVAQTVGRDKSLVVSFPKREGTDWNDSLKDSPLSQEKILARSLQRPS